MNPLVEVRDLQVAYRTRQDGRTRSVRVIDGLDLDVHEGETLAVVGESGSGKSTLAGSIVGLVRPTGGSIRFVGTELLGAKRDVRKTMQRQIQLVFQNPLLSLSPRRRVGFLLDEPLRVHTGLDGDARRARSIELVEQFELSAAILDRFPHELSGGQAQRVVLARALALEPRLMLFDEPTSALDVSVQAGVLNLLQRLKSERYLTYVFITHDLAVARHLADRIAVMRAGEVVELATAAELFTNPEHEYTRALLASSLSV